MIISFNIAPILFKINPIWNDVILDGIKNWFKMLVRLADFPIVVYCSVFLLSVFRFSFTGCMVHFTSAFSLAPRTTKFISHWWITRKLDKFCFLTINDTFYCNIFLETLLESLKATRHCSDTNLSKIL